MESAYPGYGELVVSYLHCYNLILEPFYTYQKVYNTFLRETIIIPDFSVSIS